MAFSNNLHMRIIAWVLVVVWAIFIFFMSAHLGSDLDEGVGIVGAIKHWLNGVQASILGPNVDVVSPIAHFCEYAVFGVLLEWALGMHIDWKRALVFAVVIASMYGVTDEIHQYFVPGRMCDPLDWLVDTTGAFCGALCFLAAKRKHTIA